MTRKLIRWGIDLLLVRYVLRLVAYLRSSMAARVKGANPDTAEEAPASSEHRVRRAKFWQRIGPNLLIAITIQVALFAGHARQLPTLIAAEDLAMDFVMRQFRNVELGDEHTAFVLLEIDQDTFQLWDEPFYFPRNRMQEMIEFASGYKYVPRTRTATEKHLKAQGGDPALIIVDVDLSKKGVNDDSERLREYLQNYSTQSNPPLILARTFKPLPADADEDAVPRQNSSFLDPEHDEGPYQNIFWASPHYLREEDYRIRRWLLWSQTRVEDKLAVLPSVQLLSQVLLNEKGKETAAERYKGLIEQLTTIVDCDRQAEKSQEDCTPQIVNYGRGLTEHKIDLRPSLLAERLIYSIPYDIKEGVLRPTVGSANIPLLLREPAMGLTGLDRAYLKGTVVVIGSTYRENRDWHATPIGEMPGAMVVINAIHSLGTIGPMYPPSPATMVAILVLLVMMTSLIYTRLESFYGMLAGSTLVLILLMPVSFFVFRSGVWVDFALPLLGVQLHEFAAKLKQTTDEAASETAQENVEEPTTNNGDATV